MLTAQLARAWPNKTLTQVSVCGSEFQNFWHITLLALAIQNNCELQL